MPAIPLDRRPALPLPRARKAARVAARRRALVRASRRRSASGSRRAPTGWGIGSRAPIDRCADGRAHLGCGRHRRDSGAADGAADSADGDHATTGGYAVAARSIAADLPLAGQLAPGDWVEFEPCSLGTADAALRDGRPRLTPSSEVFHETMVARFGPDRFARDAAARAVHDLQGRRTGRMAPRTRASDEIVDALRIAHASGVRGDAARRRFERADRRPWRSGPGRSGRAAGRSSSSIATACAPMRPTTINGLVRWTIHRGIAGLEAWAGTPGTVGGAIFGNAHFGGRLIGELVESVRLAGRDGIDARSFARRDGIRLRSKPLAEDRRSAVVGRLPRCRQAIRRRSARSRGSRSRIANRRSRSRRRAPAAFFRIPIARQCPPDIPASAGALVDRAGLKGEARGDARVSPRTGISSSTKGTRPRPTFAASSICAGRASASSSA